MPLFVCALLARHRSGCFPCTTFSQEAGNVPYVTDNHFGLYRKRPRDIAHEVSDLLGDKEKLEAMGRNAKSMGRPHATLDIARSLVSTMLPGTTEVDQPPSTSM